MKGYLEENIPVFFILCMFLCLVVLVLYNMLYPSYSKKADKDFHNATLDNQQLNCCYRNIKQDKRNKRLHAGDFGP